MIPAASQRSYLPLQRPHTTRAPKQCDSQPWAPLGSCSLLRALRYPRSLTLPTTRTSDLVQPELRGSCSTVRKQAPYAPPPTTLLRQRLLGSCVARDNKPRQEPMRCPYRSCYRCCASKISRARRSATPAGTATFTTLARKAWHCCIGWCARSWGRVSTLVGRYGGAAVAKVAMGGMRGHWITPGQRNKRGVVV